MRTLRASISILSACLAFAFAPLTRGEPIQGAISFDGRVTLNTTNVNTAAQVVAWVSPTVEAADGDFASFVAPNDAVAFFAPWNFNTTNPITNFWQVGGFHFDLLSSSVIFQNYGMVAVEGAGVIYGNNFTPTAGTWSFTTQNPSSRGRFSFSASSATVPEGGATVSLIGAVLVLAAATFRRPTAKRVGQPYNPSLSARQQIETNAISN